MRMHDVDRGEASCTRDIRCEAMTMECGTRATTSIEVARGEGYSEPSREIAAAMEVAARG
jgi:hypothetical protein